MNASYAPVSMNSQIIDILGMLIIACGLHMVAQCMRACIQSTSVKAQNFLQSALLLQQLTNNSYRFVYAGKLFVQLSARPQLCLTSLPAYAPIVTAIL